MNEYPSQARVRLTNAVCSGVAAFVALLAFTLWIGGLPEFVGFVSAFIRSFLLISLLAFVLDGFLKARRVRWSLLVGILSGIAGGSAIALRAMAGI